MVAARLGRGGFEIETRIHGGKRGLDSKPFELLAKLFGRLDRVGEHRQEESLLGQREQGAHHARKGAGVARNRIAAQAAGGLELVDLGPSEAMGKKKRAEGLAHFAATALGGHEIFAIPTVVKRLVIAVHAQRRHQPP